MNKNKLVSVCMRTHEIGDCLPRTMQWCVNHFEEINVVDSGESKDNTIEVLDRFKDHVNIFTRPDDGFKNQSNFILEKSTKPWTLMIDGDEIIYGPWTMDQIVRLLEKQDKTMAVFDRINFQKDVYHRRSPVTIDYQYRLFKNTTRMTGEMHDLFDLSKERLMLIPKMIMLHWGHVRSEKRLLEKSQLYKKFVDIDNVDGANIQKYDDWFVRRNKEWNKNIASIEDKDLIKYIEKWDKLGEQ